MWAWPLFSFFCLSFLHLDFCSFWDHIFVNFGTQDGSQNRPRIDQNSIKNLISFLMPFWKGKHVPASSSWDPWPSFLLVGPILLKGFYFLIKSHVWPNLVLLGSIVGGFGSPSWHFLATKNQSNFFDPFLIDFGTILGPKMDPKSSQSRRSHWSWGCCLGSWSQLGTPRGSKKVLERQKRPKSDLQEGFIASKTSPKWAPRPHFNHFFRPHPGPWLYPGPWPYPGPCWVNHI